MLRFLKLSSGSALPGRVIEVLDPKFLVRMMMKLPYGVVVVTGTNGKTTTTHFVAEMLRAQGLRVFTNRSGSNFTRGIISELLHQVSLLGNPRADVAVLELDEAYGVHFAKLVPPRIALFLNVMRDQLDRFGELDYTLSLLSEIAKRTTETVILNRDDSYVNQIGDQLDPKVRLQYFGASPELLQQYFVNDDQLYNSKKSKRNADLNVEEVESTPLPSLYRSAVQNSQPTTTTHTTILEQFEVTDQTSTITFYQNGHKTVAETHISGVHNLLNSVAALSATYAVLSSEIAGNKLIAALNNLSTTFGRGEQINHNGEDYELVLVKNPAGFRIALKSFEPDNCPVMILINDDYADGRDVSWLYDVDFSALKKKKYVKSSNSKGVVIGGHRAYDLALKFKYTDNPVQSVNTDIRCALADFATIPAPKKRIYATYTAMLKVRSELRGKKGLD